VTTHPADSRGLRLTARPPGADEPVRVYDVLVVTTSEAGAFEEFQAHPPAGDPPAELGRGLSIQQLASDVAELVMNACELRGHYYFAQRQYGCRYAFVLEQPLREAHTFRWDPEEVIRDALVLSRLVRDNDHSTEYSARVTEYESGELRVMPHDGGESRYVYRMLNERDWMDAAEARTLAGLLAAFWSTGRLPRRLERTLWASEHVAWERYLDVILPTLVAALEGMLNTSARQVVRQFTTRVPALADELGVPDVSKRLCRRMYDARSQGAHGTDIDLLKPEARRDETVRQLSRLQTVLRGALRRGIEDPAFRTAFESDESVRTRWPVTVRHRAWWWRRTPL
jgi:hypothetical protein